jgi:chromosome segregation ATPase
MTDNDNGTPTPTPATPPAGEDVEKLKKEHNELGYKVRTMEKELTNAKQQVEELQKTANEANTAKLELLKTRLAYEAGLPSRLLTLVVGSTEEDIKAKIELIRTEFGGSQITTVTPTTTTTITPSIPTPPTPASTGESELDKWMKADLKTRQKMEKDWKDKNIKVF